MSIDSKCHSHFANKKKKPTFIQTFIKAGTFLSEIGGDVPVFLLLEPPKEQATMPTNLPNRTT